MVDSVQERRCNANINTPLPLHKYTSQFNTTLRNAMTPEIYAELELRPVALSFMYLFMISFPLTSPPLFFLKIFLIITFITTLCHGERTHVRGSGTRRVLH